MSSTPVNSIGRESMGKPKHWRSYTSIPNPEITPQRRKVVSCFPDNPTHTGNMLIKSGDKPGYKRRYFCLKHKFLLSARSDKSKNLERAIPLEGTNESQTSKKSFEVKTKKKVYYFKCPTAEECETWVRLLKKASTLQLQDIYKIGRKLGISETQNTKVVKGTHLVTGDRVAIKIIDKSRSNVKLLQTELAVLKQVKHECVVQLYDLFETKKYLHLVMELCEGGELLERLVSLGEGGHYDEVQCCKIIHQIARGVKYMHSNGIVHRDLKPENILFQDKSAMKVKVADFGISKVLHRKHELMKTMCGTLSYLAPEVLKGRLYDRRVDYWSLGVIMYLLLCGKPPFVANGDSQLAKSILNDDINLDTEEWDHVSMPAKNLVKNLLSRDPCKRGTLDDVLKLTWRESADTESFKVARRNLKKHVVKDKLRRMSCDINSNATVQKFSRTANGSKFDVDSKSSGQWTPACKSERNSSKTKLIKSLLTKVDVDKGVTATKKQNFELLDKNHMAMPYTNCNQQVPRALNTNITPPAILKMEDFKSLDDWIFESKEEETEKGGKYKENDLLECKFMNSFNSSLPLNLEPKASDVLLKLPRTDKQEQWNTDISSRIKTLKVRVPNREMSHSSFSKDSLPKRQLSNSFKQPYVPKFSRIYKQRI